MTSLLRLDDVRAEIDTDEGPVSVLNGVSLDIPPGGSLALVGESGSGKSMTALAIMGLLPKPGGRLTTGDIHFDGERLDQLGPRQRCAFRGKRIGMIFQDPMTCLNPVQRIGQQLAEVLQLHGAAGNDTEAQVLALLDEVGIPQPEQRMAQFPHQLSGGQRQRVMIAMALACRPALLIADEPTTALDVTIQADIMALIRRLQQQQQMAMLFITHDLQLVAETCEQVAVMYAGRIVETGPISACFEQPAHPYTRALLAATPRMDTPRKGRIEAIEGQPPRRLESRADCAFHPRCPLASEKCRTELPAMEQAGPDHRSACFHRERML